jgi:hypothetical protein
MSVNARKGIIASRRNVRRVAVASVSAAMLFGLIGAQAGAAEVSAPARAPLTTPAVLPPMNPPGPCNPEETGQEKIGPDGEVCMRAARFGYGSMRS